MLNLVTVTGADDFTSHDKIIELTQEFPKTEWGILLSYTQNRPRFPSTEWIKNLPENLQYSLHLCGKCVQEISTGDWNFLKVLGLETTLHKFSRVQLNFHGLDHFPTHNHKPFILGIRNVLKTFNFKIIIQMDGVNDWVLDKREEIAMDGLFDLSHGAGILPDQWEKQIEGLYCGYAGGLSPENVATELEKIKPLVKEPFWIDAETHLRTHEVLDTDKVRLFLQNSGINNG